MRANKLGGLGIPSVQEESSAQWNGDFKGSPRINISFGFTTTDVQDLLVDEKRMVMIMSPFHCKLDDVISSDSSSTMTLERCHLSIERK